jgi:hypothetical protein
MRLDASGNLGLGVTPSAWYATSTKALQMPSGSLQAFSTSVFVIKQNAFANASSVDTYVNTGSASQYEQGFGIHKWYTAPSGTAGNAITFTQAMTLDASGRLGLGTTDASTGGGQMVISQAQVNGLVINASSASYSPTLYLRDLVSSGTAKIRFMEGLGLDFITHLDNVRMTLDSSGNLGLGVTPSAWRSSDTVFQVGPIASLTSDTDVTTDVGYNYYYNASNIPIYSTTAQASRYSQYLGAHRWFNAPSGTAGDAITFTQAMTLDASGNLLVGATTSAFTSFGAKIIQGNNTNGASTIQVDNQNAGSSAFAGFGLSSAGNNWVIRTGSTAANSNRLDFVLDVSSPSVKASIDSSGNLLVGTTGISLPAYGASKVQINTALNTQGIVIDNINGDSGFVGVITRPSSTSTYDAARFMNSSSTVVGSISVSTTATTYSTSSDYRLKENIAPMTGALAKVQALKPCTYTWKENGTNGEGFIAHELQEVCPYAVTGEKDAVDADGNPKYQGIDTSFLVATLTAALQEQQAIINDLKARIETLESK